MVRSIPELVEPTQSRNKPRDFTCLTGLQRLALSLVLFVQREPPCVEFFLREVTGAHTRSRAHSPIQCS